MGDCEPCDSIIPASEQKGRGYRDKDNVPCTLLEIVYLQAQITGSWPRLERTVHFDPTCAVNLGGTVINLVGLKP